MKLFSRLSFRIPFLVMVACILCSIGVAGVVSFAVRDVLIQNYERNFVQILESKKLQLEQYFEGVKNDINVISSNGQVVNGASELINTRFANVSSADNIVRKFTSESPFLLSQRDKLTLVNDPDPYFTSHAKYHPWFKEFVDGKGYNDIMLIDTNGNIAYTVAKDADFGANIKSDKWKNTDLAKAYYSAISAKPDSEPVFFDFRRYEISQNMPVSFVSKQIVNNEGKIIGALVIEIPVSKINKIMNVPMASEQNGLYYIVGQDFLLRNDLENQDTAMTTRVEGQHINMALTGNTQSIYSKGITGNDSFTSYTPFELNNIKWALIAEVDKSAIIQPIQNLQYKIFFICFAAIMVLGGFGFVLAQKVSKPLSELIDQMRQLEKGNTSFKVRYTELNDEVGEMAKSLSSFRQSAIAKKGQLEAKENEKLFKEEKTRGIISMIRDFEDRSAQIVDAISAQAMKVQSGAKTLGDVLREAISKSQYASSASVQANETLQGIALAGQGLARYVEHINAEIMKSKSALETAVSKVKNADKDANVISHTTHEIDNIMFMMQNISEQINLLSINASIESARAGEAGKGFAIVANEVREISSQTRKISQDIASQSRNIQDATLKVSSTVVAVAESMSNLNKSSEGIMTAAEAQNEIVSSIAGGIKNAALVVNNVGDNIAFVKDVIAKTEISTNEMLKTAKSLGNEAELLAQEMKMLLSNLQQA